MVIRRQNTQPEPVMAGEYLFAMREFALVRGIFARTLLANTNLDIKTLLNPPRHLPAADVSQVGTNMVRALEEPVSSAIEFGYSMVAGIHGTVGVAIQGAKNLLEAIELFRKFMVTRSGINEIQVMAGHELARIRVRELSLRGVSRPEHVQLFFNLASLISIYTISTQLLREHEVQGSIGLNLPIEEPGTFPFEQLAHITVQFSQNECELILPLELGRLPIAQIDEELVVAARTQCEYDLSLFSSKELSEEIARIIEISEAGIPSIEEISAHFYMSPSSLQRRLREKNLTYSRIKTKVLCEKASRLLIETNSSLDDIAEHVGFSNGSNFSKAFKAWSGQTPGVYREKAAKDKLIC